MSDFNASDVLAELATYRRALERIAATVPADPGLEFAAAIAREALAMTEDQTDTMTVQPNRRTGHVVKAADFPQWKIDLFNEWFDPKPGASPNPYEGRALRAPGG